MDESMRAEYPAMLPHLPPSQAVHIFNDRVKRISKLNVEIADWLQERRRVEDQYVQGLKKLTQFRVPNAQSELGTFQAHWEMILRTVEAIALSHQRFINQVEHDVEQPLRKFAQRKEVQNIQTIQTNLQGMAKELEEAKKKWDTLSKKGAKANPAKLDQATQKLDSATNHWESQAPFIFESLQALDETRLNQLRDLLTQYGTYDGDQAQQKQGHAEVALNSLLDYDTASEIRLYAQRFTAGRPQVARPSPKPAAASAPTQAVSRQSTSTGGEPLTVVQSAYPEPRPPALIEDDRRSQHSGMRDGSSDSKLRNRLGTMLNKRRQSVHAGFGPLSASKPSSFGRSVLSRDSTQPSMPLGSSSTNLADSSNRLSSLQERPDTAGEPRRSPDLHRPSQEGSNGMARPRSSYHANGTTPTPTSPLPADILHVPPPPGPPPSKKEAETDAETDADGFTRPPTQLDPISAAQREAAADQQDSPAFMLNISKEPVIEEDPMAKQAALSNLANNLSALGAPARRSSTVRGRRNERNSVSVPVAVPEQRSVGETTSKVPTSPVAISPLSRTAAQSIAVAGQSSVPGTMSDSQSVHSSNSLGSAAHFNHPDMHHPGLNCSIAETVTATLQGGALLSAKVNGEIAFSFNASEATASESYLPIRINNTTTIEGISPNRIFVTNNASDQAHLFSLDLSHLRQSQATVGFSYRLTLGEADRIPLLVRPVWKPAGDKLGLLLQYKLNPAFRFGDGHVTLQNVVLFATYDGKASGAQTKPTGTHLKDKHLVYWRLGDVTLSADAGWQKIICRIVGEQGAEPKAGVVEARWEYSALTSDPQADGLLSVSRLEEGKGKEVELSVDDPFADTSSAHAEGRWTDVPTVRRLLSGKYEAA